MIVHSAAQAAQARELAPDVPIVIARMPPHLPAAVPAPPAAPSDLTERSVALAPAQPKCRFLFFGVVRPDKGLDVLLRALAGAVPALAGVFTGRSVPTASFAASSASLAARTVAAHDA